MRSRLLWIAGALGVAAYLHRLRRRQPVEIAADSLAADSRAADLRRTLEETRLVLEDSTPESEPLETPTPAVSGEIDERRRQVHERGRSAVDEMQPPETE